MFPIGGLGQHEADARRDAEPVHRDAEEQQQRLDEAGRSTKAQEVRTS